MLLVPVAIRSLRSAEIVCRPPAARIFSVSCGHVGKERPGGLRRGRELRAATPRRIGVGADVLAEAAALLLDGVEPGDGATHRGVVVRDTDGFETGQRGAGAVDVVHAPAAVPGAVLLLLRQQPLDAALGYVAVDVERPERF